MAVCVFTSCVVIGFGGAHAGAALETRHTVTQARAAALAVDAERAQLETSLGRAHALIRASAFAPDDPSVSHAAAEVQQATAVATSTTDIHQAVLVLAATPAPPAKPGSAADSVVASVLQGEVDTPQTARDVTEQLEHTRAELDHVRSLVDDEVAILEQARAAAKHQESLDRLDERLEHAHQELTSVRSTLEQVGERVAKPTTVTRAQDALASMARTAAAGQRLDRDDPEQVTGQLRRMTQEAATLDYRLAGLAESHEAWIVDHNLSVAESNIAVLAAHELSVDKAWEQHRLDNRKQAQALSNGWSGQPVGVSGANGRLTSDSLCELDFAPGHRLQCDAAAALTAANTDYLAQTGSPLVLTDSYRSYSLQQRTRALKPRTAARPGTSNHGWGMAVDMDRESALWLTANGADYGWVHPDWARAHGSRPEWWHLEYVATAVGAFVKPQIHGLNEPAVSVFARRNQQVPVDSSSTQPASANVTKN